MEEKVEYSMRRHRQAMSREEVDNILSAGSNGTLALISPTSYPYSLPLSYVYSKEDNAIYFHSALSGHKIDSVNYCPKASFSVVAMDSVIPSKFTTAYKSVIAFGRVEIITSDQEKRRAIEILAKKYSPLESKEATEHEIDISWKHFVIIKFSIESISGKKGKELLD